MLRISFSIFFIFVLVFVLAHGLTCQARGVDTVNPALSRSVAAALKKSRAEAGKISLPVSQEDDEVVKVAQEMAKKFHSPAFQDKVKQEQQRLTREIAKKCEATDNKQEDTDKPKKSSSELADNEKIYLFLSSSIPDETMHVYLTQIARIQDYQVIPVMRGMINGLADRKANTKYFSKVLKEDPGCRDTDQACNRFKTNILFKPSLFEKYIISQVPALVYDNGEDVFVIKGDAGLDYLLERINREAHNKNLASLTGQLKGRSF